METSSLHLKQIGTNSASTLLKKFGLKYKKHIDACINLAMVENPTEALTVTKIINTRKTHKKSIARFYDTRVPKYNTSGTINETTDSINNISVKIPPFFSNIDVWIKLVKASFEIARPKVTRESTKYQHLIFNLQPLTPM